MIRAGEECARVVLLLLAVLLGACRGSGALDEARVRELVPFATAVPVAELDALAQRGSQASIDDFESRTLTVVLCFAKGDLQEDFRALPSASMDASQLEWVHLSSKLATWFPSECLHAIEVENEGERARGRFRFHRARLFEGFAEFEAELRDGEWTLTRFRLPLTGLETRLSAQGLWRSNLPAELALDERERVRALPHDRRFTARVVDLDGHSVPEAELELHAEGLDVRRTTTDAEGRATFAALPAIECAVRLRRYGRVRAHPHLLPPARCLLVPNGQELVLAFRVGVPLMGRALDPEGRGVAGAVVQISSGGTRLDRIETDAEGRWTSSGLAGAEHVIDVFLPDRGDGAWAAVLERVVPGGEEIRVELRRVR
jgi:hypothetical protein